MKILVVNVGSSSIKCALYAINHFPERAIKPIWEAHLDWKNNFDSPLLKIKSEKGDSSGVVKEKSVGEALSSIIESLFKGKKALLVSHDEIAVIGHRIVHGGKEFKEGVLIDGSVKEKIRLLAEIAPLHNLNELEGIEILEKLFKNRPQMAFFDTAFHHTLSDSAKIYPGPYEWYEESIQRYGFHGISFQYCSKRGAQLLNRPLESFKMVICHLGSGASLCAIKEGKSLDTTMGFTPLEGLMMDTRSGSVDPGILLYLLEKKKISLEELKKELFQKSGLLGISGLSSDMRDIMAKALEGNSRARMSFELYLHRLNRLIGSMVASLQGLDVLIFTAGIGENAMMLRERVCENFSFLGIKLDKIKNEEISLEDRDLSAIDSKVKILLIHTEESFEIARECWKKFSD